MIVFSRAIFAITLSVLAVPLSLAAQDDPVAQVRRVSDIASIAVAEYAEGVRDGQVLQPQEYAEARLFITEAREAAARLAPETRDAAVPTLEVLRDGIAALAPVADMQDALRTLRAELSRAVGASLDPLPEEPPSLERGALAYRSYCADCHGVDGSGRGPMAASLDPPPADLTDRAALRDVPPLEFFRKINVGVAGTAMPAFGERLNAETRWAVAFYVATLRHSTDEAAAGEALMRGQCTACAAVAADARTTVLLGDAELEVELARAYGTPLGDAGPAIVAFARRAGAIESLGGDRGLALVRSARRAASAAEAAAEHARRGDAEAAAREALDGYLWFERIEAAVRARDAAAARRVEEAFAELRVSVASADGARLEGAVLAVRARLDAAVAVVNAETSPGVLFGQSLLIMLREGLEAILIVGALVALLVRAGAGDRKRELAVGVVAAAAASLLTAAVFATVFRRAAAQQEMLEGATMLAAAAVLFWVSYWLVSKIETRQWQAFVRSQMERALASRRSWALGMVAFLAVYREGFETVLFYAALLTSAGPHVGAASAVGAGMLLGGAALIVAYWGITRFGARLPLRPFFAVTSALLYVMAFSFAGSGVAALQTAGVVGATPLPWVPSVPALGIFPTTETVGIQLVVAGALVLALGWIFWLAPRPLPLRTGG